MNVSSSDATRGGDMYAGGDKNKLIHIIWEPLPMIRDNGDGLLMEWAYNSAIAHHWWHDRTSIERLKNIVMERMTAIMLAAADGH
jgi:hypothetical protein